MGWINKKPRQISIALLFRQRMLVILMLFSLILSSCWIFLDYRNYKLESALIEEEFMHQQKDLIKAEVARTLNHIHFHIDQMALQVRDSIRQRVREAHAIATGLIEEHGDANNAQELQSMVRDAIRPIRYYSNSGYLFAVSTDGYDQLYSGEITNTDTPMAITNSDLRLSLRGQPVTNRLIDIATRHKEGFYQYNWTKPGHVGNTYPKITFVKYLEPFQWVLGTGSYLDDTENEVKTGAQEWIKGLSFDKDGHLFVLNAASRIITHSDERLIGVDMTARIDKEGTRIAKGIVTAAKHGDGFFTYFWEHPQQGDSQQVISYSRHLPEWGWVISAGIYAGELTRIIEERREKYRQLVVNQILVIIILNLVALMAIFFLVYYMSLGIEKGFNSFSVFFDQAALASKKMVSTEFRFVEFKKLARAANRMLEIREQMERRRIETEYYLRLNAAVFATTAEGILITDLLGKIVSVNPAFAAITGYSDTEIIGRRPVVLNSGHHDQEFWRIFWRALTSEGNWFGEIINRKKSGELYTQETRVNLIRNEKGQPLHYVALLSDITERKAAEELLRSQSVKDELTGVANRRSFDQFINAEWRRAVRTASPVALIMIDVDNFKAFNDGYGHLAGDECLQSLAVIFTKVINRPTDLVARYGGEEFVVVLPMTDLSGAEIIAEVIRERVEIARMPHAYCNTSSYVTVSLGVACLKAEVSSEPRMLIDKADKALYDAKRSGRNQTAVST